LKGQTPSSSFRIYPSSVTQTEPVAAISKSNPNLIFTSSVTFNTASAFKSEGVYVSTNGGNSWFGSDTCNGPIIINHGGDPGVAITPNNRLILTHIGLVFPGLYSHYSDNLGATWSPSFTITTQQCEDKTSTNIDDNISSPFYGRIYSSFVTFQTSPFRVYFSYSTNNGESWVSPKVVNNPPLARSSGPDIDVSKNGIVYLAWAGMTSSAPIREDFISFAKSTNGGENWIVRENVFDVNGITGLLTSKGNIRVNGLPRIAVDNSDGAYSGRIYIITNEINNPPAGSDHDIVIRYSDNDGLSWSNGIRVNQDQINNGKIQYLPAVEVDDQGRVHILFYDDRNTTSDSAEVFLATSSDGGDTWIESQISGHGFKPKPIVGGASNYQGDYISLVSSNNKLFAFWMSDFSGIYQVWGRIIDISNSTNETTPDEFDYKLYQNYPNPFHSYSGVFSNSSTTIRFSLNKNQFVSLKVYDILGNEISILVNEEKPAGVYEVNFNRRDLPSGVYYYTLNAGSFTETKKMILMK
jgi:hypothetical protein